MGLANKMDITKPHSFSKVYQQVLVIFQVLLNDPDQVSDTWLNFASAMWFYVTPQPPKPSMLAVVDGTWKPNGQDKSKNLLEGD